MNNSLIYDRYKEIEELIASNEMNSATKRLLDFVTDFSNDRRRRREAITLRSYYNELRENARVLHKDIDIKLQELKLQILELAEILLDEYPNTNDKKDDHTQKTGKLEKKKFDENADETKIVNFFEEAKKEFKKSKQSCESKSQKKSQEDCLIFEGRGISKTYESKSLNFTLHPLDITIKKGEITALVGENGNGKTTLLKIIGGELKPNDGILRYPTFEKENNKLDWYNIKSNIAYIQQTLPKWHGVLEKNLHFSASIKGVYGSENDDNVDFIISRLSLNKYRKASWNEISGGYKTRFQLAKFLVWQPPFILLDEPLANLDVNTQLMFLQDLRNLANSISNPLSMIISSQHLHEVETIADNIIFLQDGKDVYNGKMQDFGLDRTVNSFEIECNLNKDKLLDVLEKINFLDIEENGNQYIINTPLAVSKFDFLRLFVAQNIELSFFRDISKSTRKLFKKNQL